MQRSSQFFLKVSQDFLPVLRKEFCSLDILHMQYPLQTFLLPAKSDLVLLKVNKISWMFSIKTIKVNLWDVHKLWEVLSFLNIKIHLLYGLNRVSFWRLLKNLTSVDSDVKQHQQHNIFRSNDL